ncbi:MAG: class I SAM-dependent methyltransferase [Firmicutes bacterium]|nr:class I SAM-dependent methyltransferase [Bacillota bacterium]
MAANFEEFGPEIYDLMVDWERRLANESEFFQQTFESHGVKRVLDCACGTGRHALLFARWGLEVTATDASPAMIEMAARHAALEQARIDLGQVPFHKLGVWSQRTRQRFDALICIGNSLSLVAGPAQLGRSLKAMHQALVPGGLAVFQVQNYGRLAAYKQRFTSPRGVRTADLEYLFFKFLDPLPAARGVVPRATMNLAVFERPLDRDGGWRLSVRTSKLLVISRRLLQGTLASAGFSNPSFFGDYHFSAFDPKESQDLLVTATA